MTKQITTLSSSLPISHPQYLQVDAGQTQNQAPKASSSSAPQNLSSKSKAKSQVADLNAFYGIDGDGQYTNACC